MNLLLVITIIALIILIIVSTVIIARIKPKENYGQLYYYYLVNTMREDVNDKAVNRIDNLYIIQDMGQDPVKFPILAQRNTSLFIAAQVYTISATGTKIFIPPLEDRNGKLILPPSTLPPTQLSDIQFFDRPADGIYTITWEYQTNGHGQFIYPNPISVSPNSPPTAVYNLTGSNTTKDAVRICGSLIIADRNPYNRYTLICRKNPNSNPARKLIPYTRVINQTYNNMVWDFYNESGRKTSITLKYGEMKMINMETGITRDTELNILKIFGYAVGVAAAIPVGWFIIGAAATGAAVATEAIDAAEIEMLLNYPPPAA